MVLCYFMLCNTSIQIIHYFSLFPFKSQTETNAKSFTIYLLFGNSILFFYAFVVLLFTLFIIFPYFRSSLKQKPTPKVLLFIYYLEMVYYFFMLL